MLNIGDYNTLEIVKHLDFGMYLKSGELEILLPTKYIPEGAAIGQMIDVFIYTDSEDRLIASNLKPLATVNEFAYLTVSHVSQYGAFLNIGLEKDILVPLSEQKDKMVEGRGYVVFVYLDTMTDRMVASAKISDFVIKDSIDLKEKQEVNLLVAAITPLGFNVIVDNQYIALVYANEVFTEVKVGDQLVGYVRKIREDNKIDISLQPIGFEKRINADTEVIMEALLKNNGTLNISDSSTPGTIYKAVGMSKKAFKKASGVLYREKKIAIFPDKLQIFTPKK